MAEDPDPCAVARTAELAAAEGDAETLEAAALELLGHARKQRGRAGQ
jgi:hypothetical protein